MAPLFHITGLVCHLATARASATPLLLMHRFDPGEFLRLVERWRGTYVIGPLTAFIALLEHPDFGAPRPLLADQGGERRRPGLPGDGRALGEPDRQLRPQHLRADRDRGALAHGPARRARAGRPGERRPLDRPADRRHRLEDRRARRAGRRRGRRRRRGHHDGSGPAEVEAAPGELGEIVTRGPAVTPGYWGRPEETAKAIHDGWLHTGDVGKRDADGWFYIVDRIKDMIVVSGYKVWPRDVEDALIAHPAVREVAVVGEPDPYRGETVAAHVVLRPGAEATGTDELIAHCRERLAVYKAPHVVHLVAELPKTASGKTLRRELRRDEQGAERAAAPAPPPGATSSS